MKLTIFFYDTQLKKKTSKVLSPKTFDLLNIINQCFEAYLLEKKYFMGVQEVSFALTLCGKRKIQSMNQRFRQIDKVTDVLSFPVYQNLRLDKKGIKEIYPPFLEMGDVVICKEKAKQQALKFKISYEAEIIHLAAHGFLHLLGYDHDISLKEEKIMEKLESLLVLKCLKKCKKICKKI